MIYWLAYKFVSVVFSLHYTFAKKLDFFGPELVAVIFYFVLIVS